MARRLHDHDTLQPLDEATATLLDLAAAIAVGSESQVRESAGAAAQATRRQRLDPVWVEELILQSYLFVGFPRALNAARAWRKLSARSAPARDAYAERAETAEWTEQGERTCAVVYGRMYEALRANIRSLHPALDAWMITEGYGKVLSRPGLDLMRRELCIVVVCAVTDQERQLHSHLYGARNAGATPPQVAQALRIAARFVGAERARRASQLWARVSRH